MIVEIGSQKCLLLLPPSFLDSALLSVFYLLSPTCTRIRHCSHSQSIPCCSCHCLLRGKTPHSPALLQCDSLSQETVCHKVLLSGQVSPIDHNSHSTRLLHCTLPSELQASLDRISFPSMRSFKGCRQDSAPLLHS